MMIHRDNQTQKKKKKSHAEVPSSPPPTMTLRGKYAKGMKALTMDQPVSVTVKGHVRSIGRGYDDEPNLEIEMSHAHVTPAKRRAFMKAMKEA